jgi:hypothetical protein
MARQWGVRLAGLCLLGVLGGCCSPTIYVETTIHPDGSCDRMIWQPKDKFLPDQALGLAWNARWKSVSDAAGPHRNSGSRASADECKYFIARGAFHSPQEIPPHYRHVDGDVPDVGSSELKRTYKRKDYGFVVEHRWNETITDIVTLTMFLKARNELLDLLLTICTEAIEKQFGNSHDVSGLVTYIRSEGRQFLEAGSLILYDAAARHRVMRDEHVVDPEVAVALGEQAKRFGLELPEKNGKPVWDGNGEDICGLTIRRLVMRHVRHRDGTALTAAEADALIRRAFEDDIFQKADTQKAKELKKRAKSILRRMTGLYLVDLGPHFEFVLHLPGELVETNGTGTRAGRTRWEFVGSEAFPDGYEMKARSLFIDVEAQKKILGHVAIDCETKAFEYIELAGEDGPVLEALRKLHQTGDRGGLRQVQTRSFQESLRARKLRKMLFNE